MHALTRPRGDGDISVRSPRGGTAAARRAGVEVIDFGKGDPNEPTDPIIRQALIDAVPERGAVPARAGAPGAAAAVADWCKRRFGVELDPDTEIVPTYGSRRRSSRSRRCSSTAGRDHVVVRRSPRIPVYERGALFAGAEVADAAAAARERLPARRSTRSPWERHRDRLGQLPEQPDRSRGPARVLRAAAPARGRARLPASPPTRRTASSGSTAAARRR